MDNIDLLLSSEAPTKTTDKIKKGFQETIVQPLKYVTSKYYVIFGALVLAIIIVVGGLMILAGLAGRSNDNTIEKGRFIKYTKRHPFFSTLTPDDKVNYAVFMLDYDVEKHREFSDGATDVIKYRKIHNANDFFYNVGQFIITGDSLKMVLRPQRLNILLMFVCFATLVGLVIGVLVLFIVGRFRTIPMVKYKILGTLILTFLATLGFLYIIDYLLNRTMTAIEGVDEAIM